MGGFVFFCFFFQIIFKLLFSFSLAHSLSLSYILSLCHLSHFFSLSLISILVLCFIFQMKIFKSCNCLLSFQQFLYFFSLSFKKSLSKFEKKKNLFSTPPPHIQISVIEEKSEQVIWWSYLVKNRPEGKKEIIKRKKTSW